MPPKIGDVRVNAEDYEGDIVVEQWNYWNHGLDWAVPAWDESGQPDLSGPFEDVASAERAVRLCWNV